MKINKRFYGELIAKIVEKDKIMDLNDSSIYLKENTIDDNLTMLNYNQHALKLKYDYHITSKCVDGCYLLITYNQKKSEGDYPIIGYEFTLLSRSWNYTDFISQIVDIPFNEYILGSFEIDSITHHYYSISIPDDTEKIIIQLEGNYIDGFYGEGRRKINTKKIRKNDNNLNIINNKNVIVLNKSQINSKNKIVSLAFRPKDYLSNIFSFYYFRILYIKTNEIIYYPIDSQIENLCLPEYNYTTNLYYCHLIFQNKYDELKTNFSVSSSNQNEYFKIYITKIYKNNSGIYNELKDMIYIYYNNINNTNDIDYFIFTFEFDNNEIKSIISSFNEKINDYYPQVYSSQMFYIIDFNKTSLYKLDNNYILEYKYIYGTSNKSGWIDFPYPDNNGSYSTYINRNFRGRSFLYDINSDINTIFFRINDGCEFILVVKLEYNMRNKQEVK